MPYTAARLAYSIGSPTGVPVPCASTMPTVAASTPAAANAARYTATCASSDGVAMFTVRPSWLAAVPRTTARIRSPSRSASGKPLEQQHGAALAGHEPVGGDVERVAAAGGRQHALRRPGDGLARFQHHRDAAGEGEVAFAVVQAAAGQVHRHQARRARRVDRDRGAVQSQGVGDPTRRQAVVGAGEPVRPLHGAAHRRPAVRSRRASTRRRHRSASPASVAGSRPACSTASQEVSSSRRCCGSIAVASRSSIPKNSESKPPTSSRKAPHRDTDRPGTPGSGS